jgi:predicted transcriptional regulator
MEREELRWRIEELENELADLYSMSEEAACFRYNVDYKEEAVESINAELSDLYKRLEEVIEEEEVAEYGCDPAFRTMADFYRMRI